jgi:hypothetical protein
MHRNGGCRVRRIADDCQLEAAPGLARKTAAAAAARIILLTQAYVIYLTTINHGG